MSVDIKDHRRYAEGKMAEARQQAEENVAKQALLHQAPSEAANTGDDHLDKLARTVQEMLDMFEKRLVEVALTGISCVNEEMIRKTQAEFFYAKGHVEAYKAVLQIPGRIIAESKPAPMHVV